MHNLWKLKWATCKYSQFHFRFHDSFHAERHYVYFENNLFKVVSLGQIVYTISYYRPITKILYFSLYFFLSLQSIYGLLLHYKTEVTPNIKSPDITMILSSIRKNINSDWWVSIEMNFLILPQLFRKKVCICYFLLFPINSVFTSVSGKKWD